MIVTIAPELRRDGPQFEGRIIEIITPPDVDYVADGIEVRIDDGIIGNVISINEDIVVEVRKLLREQESETLEFKETFQFDIVENMKNRRLGNGSVKTIAAFANTRGGTLLIGVSDDHVPVGLERDYNLLKQLHPLQSKQDMFMLNLEDYIRNRLIISEETPYKIEIASIDDKDICIVKVNVAKHPVFVKTELLCSECEIKKLNGNPSYLYYKRETSSSSPRTPHHICKPR